MEFLLLWIDELDDAVGTLRHLAPKILGFCCALVLFVGTTLAFSLAPEATLVGVLALVLSASLVEAVRRRRLALREERGSDY
jgi:hypothetical protein